MLSKEDLMIEGYKEMADEHEKFAQDYQHIGDEVLSNKEGNMYKPIQANEETTIRDNHCFVLLL